MDYFLEIRFVGREFRPFIRGNSIKIFSKSFPKFHYGPKGLRKVNKISLSRTPLLVEFWNVLLKNSFFIKLGISYNVIRIFEF